MSVYRDLVVPQTVQDFVNHKDRCFALLADAFRLYKQAEEEIKKVDRFGFPIGRLQDSSLEGMTKEINRRIWRTAFNHTGLLQLMDHQAVQEFEKDLDKNVPDFTIENIQATFLSVYQQKDDLFIRGLINVFRRLCREYKTNQESFKVPEKMIVGWWTENNWSGKGRRVNSRRSEEVNDMDRVFKTLAGEKHHPRSLETAVNGSWSQGEIYEDAYYQIKGFKNGNAHIKFKRLDLLEKANELIHEYYHGNAVPDGRHAA